MAKIIRSASPTSVVMRVKLMDSTSTAGAGKTGLTNASTGLIISSLRLNEASPTVYTSGASNVETITTLGTFATPTAGKCRFKEVDATNHPGVYELQFDDARFTSIGLIISISGVTGLAQGDFEIQCENLGVQVKGIDSGAITATAIATGAITNAKFAAGAIDAASIASDAITAAKIASDAISNVKIANDAIDANKFKQDAADKIWASATRALTDKINFALTSAYDAAKTAAQAGDAMALTSGERTSLTAVIWNALTSGMTTVGSIGKKLADWTIGTLLSTERVKLDATQPDYAPSKAGDQMDIVNAPNSTGLAAIATAVWASGTRTLSSFGTLVADVATAVWGAGTRTLSSFGTLISDIWTAATRSLTDKANFTLSSAYDPAKTASQAGDAMALTSGERTTLTTSIWDALTSGMTTVGSIGKKLADWIIGSLLSTERVKLDASQPDYAPSKAGDAMALTSGERTSLDGVLTTAHGSGSWQTGGSGLTAQQVRDAMALSTSSVPLDGSVDLMLRQIKAVELLGATAGKVKFVLQTGLNSNTGDSWAQAYLTIAYAITALGTGGGALYLAGGNWSEDVDVPDNVKVFGTADASGNLTYILGAASSGVPSLTLGNNSEAHNLKVRKTNNDGSADYVVLMKSNTLLEGVIHPESGTSGSITIDSIIGLSGTHHRIRKCMLSASYGGHCLINGALNKTSITDNVFQTNGDDYIKGIGSGLSGEIRRNVFLDIGTGYYGVNVPADRVAVTDNRWRGNGTFEKYPTTGTNHLVAENIHVGEDTQAIYTAIGSLGDGIEINSIQDVMEVSRLNMIEFNLRNNGVGVTGQTVKLIIKYPGSGEWWWDGSDWVGAQVILTMTESDSVNSPGLYSYGFTPVLTMTVTPGQLIIKRYISSGPYALEISNDAALRDDLTTINTFLTDISSEVGPVNALEVKAIEYDFTTYTKAVVLFYDADRPFGAAVPIYWCYAYTAAGGNPSNVAEIAKRDRVKPWSTPPV